MKIINGDSLEVLKRATANSIDAVVCDPPYFLINSNGSGFMNKDWDGIMGLWKYQWNDKAFVDFVISLLKSCRVEDNMVGVNTVQEIANTQVEEKTTENNVNSVRENSNTQTKSKDSAQVIVLTRQGLLDLLSGELSVLTKLNQFLNGEKENAVYVIPIISLQSERKAIVQKSVTTLRKAIGLQEIKITFTKTDLQKKRDSIEAIIGESSENLFTKGMGGSVDTVDSIVVREKYNATTSHHTDSQETMASITLLLCAYFATRKSSEIQKDLIKTFFRVIFLEVSRVLKPGGHVLAFAGSRTYQWLATGIEDAGFDIRDMIMYVYGSGFPKSHNIGKSVDKLQGNERKVTGQSRNGSNSLMGGLSDTVTSTTQDITKGSSPYEGWGTALKPAHEPIVVARKPLSEKTIAKNVLEWGTGGINIDGCRVEYQGEADKASATPQGKCTSNSSAGSAPDVDMSEVDYHGEKYWYKNEHKDLIKKWLDDEDYVWSELKENLESPEVYNWCKLPEINDGDRILFDSIVGECVRLYESKRKEFERPKQTGRFPANFIHDGSDEVVGLFPETHGAGTFRRGKTSGEFLSAMEVQSKDQTQKAYDNGGSAARFFYCAKASKKDRNEGLEEFEATPKLNNRIDQKLMKCSFCNKYKIAKDFCKCIDPQWKVNKVGNNHPTVKPTALMQYLVRLVTPVGGTVLDPFMGSGSTGKACVLEGFDFIGIELDTEYCKIAQARIDAIK